MLFLSKVTMWEFIRDSDKMSKVSNFIFRPNGQFNILETNLISNEQVDKQAIRKIDVYSNWEDFPSFDEYSKIILKERKFKFPDQFV